ncbi:MAG: hypothetical protein GY943_03360 [Chloroflexi bacterium]|nr:hypothetical protein [Chloroflexota bacterium]
MNYKLLVAVFVFVLVVMAVFMIVSGNGVDLAQLDSGIFGHCVSSTCTI